MDFSDAALMIEEFAAPYTVTRAGTVEYDSDPGRPTASAPTTVSITASVQPVAGKDLQRLPEGTRTEEARTLYTRTQLLDDPEPDTVALEGATWQVESAEPWMGAFWKCVVRKVG